jgi:peptide/nickel transport system permease protein
MKLSYIIRRLLNMIPIVFGVMVITFILFRVVGGDISSELAGKAASKEVIQEIRHEYGWDKPLFFNVHPTSVKDFFNTQFFDHLYNSFTFNFGKSLRDRQDIWAIIKEGAVPSLSLTVPMLFIGLVISLSISLVVAYVRGGWLDKTLVFLCVVGMSMPFLSYILIGQYYFAYKWGASLNIPVFGYETGLAKIRYLILPVCIGVVSGLGSSVRFYRTVILDEIHADYVRTARAKGASRTRVLFKHVLKNAMIPVITQVVLAIPFLFLGSLLLERFFGIPGLGYLTIEAINARDYPVISAMTLIGSLLYVVGLLVTDICYALVDPRVELH